MRRAAPVVLSLLWAGAAGAAPATLSPYGELATGYESNVFLAPDAVGAAGDLVRDDVFFRGLAGLDAAWRPTGRDALSAYAEHETVRYSSFTEMNRYGFELGGAYRRALSGAWEAGLSALWERRQERGTDVFGAPLTQTYAFRAWEARPSLRWRGAGVDVRATLAFRSADYDAPASTAVQSLDHSEVRFGLRATRDFAGGAQGLARYDLEMRRYDDYIARLGAPPASVGAPDPAGSKRRQIDHHLKIGARWKGDAGGRVEARAEYDRRVDPFQDYFSYSQPGLRLIGRAALPRGAEVTGEVSVARRTYDVQDVIVPGPNPKLEKTLTDVRLEATQPLGARFKIGLSYRMENEGTNETASSAVNRDFTNHVLTLGLQASW